MQTSMIIYFHLCIYLTYYMCISMSFLNFHQDSLLEDVSILNHEMEHRDLRLIKIWLHDLMTSNFN